MTLSPPAGLARHGPAARLACALVASLLLVVVVAPGAARARKTVTIRGRGWGHGIGMSQYGAYGRALRGDGAKQILRHYYSGTRVRRTRLPARVRIGLLQGRGHVGVSSRARGPGTGRLVFKVKGSKRTLAKGGPGNAWRVEPSDTGGTRLYKDGKKVKRDGKTVFGGPDRPLMAVFAPHRSLLRLEQKDLSYAYGRMYFSTHTPASCGSLYCLRVVLSLSMHKYVYGLGEVPASWPAAVLRAQAIAARTYAYRRIVTLGQHREPCDCALYDSAIDQVYSGDGKRTGSGQYWDDWKGAVDATRGEVILYRGRPIQALYSSSSGGYTESVQNVWGGDPIPYLRGVRDAPDAVAENPNHRWSITMGWSRLSRRLNAAFGTGRLRKIKLVRPFGVSGRVTVVKSSDRGGVRIVGSSKTVRVSGWAVREAVGLKDTWFRLRVRRDGRAKPSRDAGLPIESRPRGA
ncbi:hypothetical protein BH24ACT26_BH24ACT26_04770 [soil metagenome]